VSVDRVREACEACFEAHKGDCSGSASAVAAKLRISLQGTADQIVDNLRSGQGWTLLPNRIAAAQSAKAGKLVIGGLKGSERANLAHMAMSSSCSLNHWLIMPTLSAYWRNLAGKSGKDDTPNAWIAQDRNRASYAEHNLT
jgi:hypothetical protein